MSQSILIKKIKAEAEAEVQKIKTEGESKVKELEAEMEAEISSLRQQAEDELKQEIKHRRLVELSKARQNGNLAKQRSKREAIDEIIREVLSEVSNWSADKYVNHFGQQAKMVLTNNQQQDVNVVKVLVAPGRKQETELILKEVGLSSVPSIEEDKDITAGLLLVTDNGVYDVTLDRLLDQKRTDLEMALLEASGIK